MAKPTAVVKEVQSATIEDDQRIGSGRRNQNATSIRMEFPGPFALPSGVSQEHSIRAEESQLATGFIQHQDPAIRELPCAFDS
jgi:hypothetical protein